MISPGEEKLNSEIRDYATGDKGELISLLIMTKNWQFVISFFFLRAPRILTNNYCSKKKKN